MGPACTASVTADGDGNGEGCPRPIACMTISCCCAESAGAGGLGPNRPAFHSASTALMMSRAVRGIAEIHVRTRLQGSVCAQMPLGRSLSLEWRTDLSVGRSPLVRRFSPIAAAQADPSTRRLPACITTGGGIPPLRTQVISCLLRPVR
jgi:hypothetical protein